MVKVNFWPLVGYYVVASLIGGAGAVVCGIGMIVTMPISWCLYAVAYRELTGSGRAPAEAAAPAVEPPPAPEPEAAPEPPAPEAQAAPEGVEEERTE